MAVGNGTPSKKAKPEPSKEEMHAVVAEILKKVDFNTVCPLLFSPFIVFFKKKTLQTLMDF